MNASKNFDKILALGHLSFLTLFFFIKLNSRMDSEQTI